jgi:SAM-dependent methyltransferase
MSDTGATSDLTAGHHDPATIAYFDEHLIDYGVGRLDYASEIIARLRSDDSSAVDLGCGTGNTLAYVKEHTGIEDLMGIDVSPRCLERVRERVGCATELGSIVDPELAERLSGRFEFAIVAAVLHHLIGRTRRESRLLATAALDNAMTMLRPGGYVVVLEPIFYPSLAMDALFYVKKGLTRVTSDRVKLFGRWDNNIGPPVVSYYTNEELFEMIDGAQGEIVERDIQPQAWSPGLDRILRKTNTTVVARKQST